MHARYTSSYPGQNESCPLQESRWNTRKVRLQRHPLHIMGTIVAITLLLSAWDIDILYERDTGLLQSMNASLNSMENSLHDKRPTHS